MKRSHTRLAILTAFIGLGLAGAAGGFDFSSLEESITEFDLDNGLKFIVMERHQAPVVSFVTLVNAGGVDDPKGYTGIAHMLEHMAFKGTRVLGTTDIDAELDAMKVEDSLFYELRAERKKGRFADTARMAEINAQFEEAIAAAAKFVVPNAIDQTFEPEGGVGINAGTSKDITRYTVSLPSNKIELWMAVESARFREPVFREMYRERNVITEERRQELENSPIMRSIDALQATAFSAHPYRNPNIGHMSDIHNYTRDAVIKQFQTYYVPSNMVVTIVGDVDPISVEKLAREYWSDIPSAPKPEPIATIEPPQQGERRVALSDHAQPLFLAGWHVPSQTDPDWPVIEAIADYIGEGRTSLLYKKLVKEERIAAFVGVFAGWPGDKYPCLCFVYVGAAPGHTNEECEEKVLAEVERLSIELISEEEVAQIKARARATFINNLTSNMGLATELAQYQAIWNDWHQMFDEVARIESVTPADIKRVAETYFTGNNRTIVMLNTIENKSGGDSDD